MVKYGPLPSPQPVMDPLVKTALEVQEKVFRKEAGKLQNELNVPKPTDTVIEAGILTLRTLKEALFTAQDKALEYLLQHNADAYLAEMEKRADYQKEMELLEVTAQRVLAKIAGVNADDKHSHANSYHRVNLPQRKLQPFNGDVREWLGFWSSFEDIHDDVGLSENDKFQYLLECIPKTSTARKIIDGFTVSAKNYQTAVETLKNLYGRDRMLIKVYVRDLLQLVIDNATKASTMDFLDLYPKLSSHIRNLGELGVTSDKCEEILYPVVESCLPEDILLAWQRYPTYEEKLDKLMDFLNTEVNNKMDRCLAKMQFSTASQDKPGKGKKEKQVDPPAAIAFMNAQQHEQEKNKKPSGCVFCDDSRHESHDCGKAKTQMTLEQKQAVVKEKKYCYRCLRSGHFSGRCKRFVKCCICGGKHYEVMCDAKKKEDEKARNFMLAAQYQNGNVGVSGQQTGFYGQPQPYIQQQQRQVQNNAADLWSASQSATTNKAAKTSFTATGGDRKITLSSLIAVLEAPTRSWKVRVFLDGGAEVSYIKQEIADGAGLPLVGERHFRHQRFGGDVTEKKRHPRYQITLCSLDGQFKRNFVVHGIDRIAIHISKPHYGDYTAQCAQQGIYFHDQMRATGDVDVMFGMDILSQIWTGGFYRISPVLYAAETSFGWVIGGEEPEVEESYVSTSNMVTLMMVNEQTVENLWALEAMGIQEDSTSETKEDLEKATIKYFEETVSRQDDGRYIVHLPWKDGHRKLTSNFHSSLYRLKKTTADLKKQNYWEAYDRIFRDWEEEKIIEEVPEVEMDKLVDKYLLPHPHVVKESSSTTPVRPVFDASAKGKGGPSLNECLSAGPNMLELIPAIMCRFRKQRIGAVSDIKKAFLQIGLDRDDQEYLCFLWWKDTTCQELKVYRHQRVVFGVKPSPFLLAATLTHHVNAVCQADPLFGKMLLDSLYVDNSCSSHATMEDAMKFKEGSQQVLLPAKFDLRGWEFTNCNNSTTVPVLGMCWDNHSDVIRFSLDSIKSKMNGPNSKRGLLSLVNSLFDPMGFVCAFSVIPKLLLQDCCKLKMGWDDDLPEEISAKLIKWKAQVPVIDKIHIPRWIGFSKENCSLSVHCFCDASGYCFATTIFLRAVIGENATVQLIMAKARVAPAKKKVTIPRLELLGCGIGARLTAKYALKYLELEDVPTYYWTDSTTALTWIQKDKEWARFVANRVEAIRKITKIEDWRHVPGELNPADVPSRGCTAEYIVEKKLWEGPDWLKKPMEFWPNYIPAANEDDVNAEVKKSVVVCSDQIQEDAILTRLQKYSDYHQILRIMAVMIRYLRRLRQKAANRKTGSSIITFLKKTPTPATADEIEEAERMLLRLVQKDSFTGTTDKRILGMGAFMDVHGLIRVKSQLLFGKDDYNLRCPVVLPHNHPIVKTLIYKEHCVNSHAGVQILQANLRERYWILKSRKAIGGVVTACPTCRRYIARRCVVPPAPLPFSRVKNTVAFDVTGVDLAGPLYLRGGSKAWIVLFTCAVYRAVHLELVTTLSTQGFLNAFRRFVARRGRPSKIYSDNGLNFVGCANLFKEVDWNAVQSYAAVTRMSWVLNPPTAAWWGGFWERMVGLVKQLLRRILGKTVDQEELQTLLCDVESTLNQRPLTYASDRKEELMPLCPSHFIKDNPSSNLPEADVVDAKELRKNLKMCQVLRDELRVRFRKEYLGQLQHQAGIKEKTVKVGDVVIVEDDNKKRIEWSLGVVLDVYPGRDGRVRTARVRTKDGLFLRAVQRLFLMEVAEEDKEEEAPPEVEEKAGEEEEKISRFGRTLVKPDRFKF